MLKVKNLKMLKIDKRHKPKYYQSFLLVLNTDSQGLPNYFSWELNVPKLLVLEEVGGTNFHRLIFLWVREDEILVNFKLGNHKDD